MCLSTLCAELAVKQAAQPILPGNDPFSMLIGQFEGECQTMAEKVARGLMSPDKFEEEFGLLVERFHMAAHIQGQEVLGMRIVSLARDKAFQIMHITANAQGPEMDWVKNFARDIASASRNVADEAGVLSIQKILTRMRLYGGKMRGTSAWGTLDVSHPSDMWEWRMGRVEDHCFDCPHNASLGGFTKDQWYTTPGAGDTPCLFNCKCTLVRVSDGLSTASPVLRVA